MESDGSNSPTIPKNEYSERLAENVEGFNQSLDEALEKIKQDDNFNEMTAERYEQEDNYMTSHLLELSAMHNSLSDQYDYLIKKVKKHYPSLLQNQHPESSNSASPPQVTQTRAPKCSSATGFDALLQPDGGGFYLSKGKGSSHSGSESSKSSVNKPPVPPVKNDASKVQENQDSGSDSSISSVKKPSVLPPPIIDDALKVEETKDSGSESSISSVNKPAVAPVNDDVLKVDGTKDPEALLEKDFQSAVPPVNDDALKLDETKDHGSESSMSSVSKPAVPPPVIDDALNVEETKDSGSESSMSSVNDDDSLKVEETKDHEALLKKISNFKEEVASLKQKLQSLTVENGELKMEIEENIADVSVYMSETKQETDTIKEELKVSKEFAKTIDAHMCKVLAEKIADLSKHDSEISQLKATHEKKEKIFNDIKGQLRHQLDEKGELIDELIKSVGKKNDQLHTLYADKHSQDTLIQQLKTELNSVKSENVGLLSSFDNVQKLTGVMKLKMVELEIEVDRQREAMSSRE